MRVTSARPNRAGRHFETPDALQKELNITYHLFITTTPPSSPPFQARMRRHVPGRWWAGFEKA
jgi:hypothetical protein